MAKSTKSGLGRGLNSLLGAYEEPVAPEPPVRQRVVVEAETVSAPESQPAPESHEAPQEVKDVQNDDEELFVEENVQIKGIVERKLDEVPIDYVSPNPCLLYTSRCV